MSQTNTNISASKSAMIKIKCGCGSSYFHTGELGYCKKCKKIDLTKYVVKYTLKI